MKSGRLTYFLLGLTAGLLVAFFDRTGSPYAFSVPVCMLAALASQERDARLHRRHSAAARAGDTAAEER